MMDVEVVKRKNMYSFHENDEEYLKIIMQFPADVTTYRDYLHVVREFAYGLIIVWNQWWGFQRLLRYSKRSARQTNEY